MTDTSIQDKPFTVQVGKRYWREDGEISGTLSQLNRWKPFQDLSNSIDYREDGKVYMCSPSLARLIREYKEPTAEPQDEFGDWIGWNGGECPVGGSDEVEVVVSGQNNLGSYANFWTGEAVDVGWNNPNASIIAYRIKKEPEVRVRNMWIDDECNFDTYNFKDSRMAIITLTDGEPSIRWAE